MTRVSIHTKSATEQQAYAAEHEQYIKTTSALAEHHQFHGAHGSGNDRHFLHWHRFYLRKLENHLGAAGVTHHVPIPFWASNTPIPPALAAGTNNQNPNVAPPSWTTLQGGATAAPVHGHTSLRQFRSSDELGNSIAGYHGSVHNAVGGTMATFDSPQAPIFYPWHAFVDTIWESFQRGGSPMPLLLARGSVASPNDTRVRLNLFARGTNRRLMERYWNGAGWSWTDTGKEIFGRPVALIRGNSRSVNGADVRINLFVQGMDGKLWERYWNGAAWSWVDTGKLVAGDPVILTRGNVESTDGQDIRINLFVRGQDGKLWERYWDGANWSWIDTGRLVDGDPVVLARGDVEDVLANDIRINLFVRGQDGNLWERYWNGAAWSWINTGKSVANAPALVARGNLGSPDATKVRINLFVQGADGKLWERYWNGTGWSWTDTGKAVSGVPAILLRGNDRSINGADVRINLFVQGADGKLWERYWNGAAWSWVDTGKQVDGPPLILARGNLGDVSGANLRINLFARVVEWDATNHPHLKLWERYWNGAAWSWVDHGKEVAGDPVASMRGDVEDVPADDVRINLFIAGDDGRLWERYWNGAAWSWVDTGPIAI